MQEHRVGAGPGLLALVGAGPPVDARLPMLEVVLERLERRLGASLRGLAGSALEIRQEPPESGRLGDHLAALPPHTMVATFEAIEWQGCGFVAIDGPLIAMTVDLLLGGGQASAAPPSEGRRHTAIETALVERLVRLVLADLAQAFEPVAPVRLRLEGIETEPRLLAVDRPAGACAVARLGIGLAERRGTLAIIMPHGTLEPVRGRLAQPFAGERLGRDPIWARHLAGELWEVGIQLEAVIEESILPLREALALEVGSVLPLAVRPDASVALRYAGRTMLRGKLGRIGDRVAVRIEERLIDGPGDTHG